MLLTKRKKLFLFGVVARGSFSLTKILNVYQRVYNEKPQPSRKLCTFATTQKGLIESVLRPLQVTIYRWQLGLFLFKDNLPIYPLSFFLTRYL
ncbi:hypothetical protein HMPREF1869_01818 [Bacteroidales bacterium KA00251]|nr:hypothetical protein HMPREF1869_01818 [Bacteroidales bacterium KA00251]